MDNQDEARSVIAGRLREDAPEMAELYEAGLDIINGTRREAHKYLLAHVMREIRTRLPAHYRVANVNPRLEYAAAVAVFRDSWVNDVRPRLQTVGETYPPSEELVISRRTASEIDALVQRHDEIPMGIRDLYVRLSERVNPTKYPTSLAVGTLEQWLELPLPGMAHIPGPAQRSFSLEQCLSAWNVMEGYLYYLFAPAHITYSELDEILEEANLT